ncbi:hypothetical protein SAMN05421630_103452 [Prauserella marina]|uniref:Uncharacterized protein n=1 Tax=Prauserella marina TaxID=530584 RepID=A0A1G6P248_9PSEU|nr:hypothetical protein DES30_102916 [Prauserella marina]SDC74350.1 hypothetical protein SAMN05421630_103452 [Prauserella marina]
MRTADAALREAQTLLNEGKPFHAHEVFEDAWKSGPDTERELWRGLAQLAVGITHAARGNLTGAASLLRRGADNITPFADAPPHDIDIAGLATWAHTLADGLPGRHDPPEAATIAPTLRARQ